MDTLSNTNNSDLPGPSQPLGQPSLAPERTTPQHVRSSPTNGHDVMNIDVHGGPVQIYNIFEPGATPVDVMRNITVHGGAVQLYNIFGPGSTETQPPPPPNGQMIAPPSPQVPASSQSFLTVNTQLSVNTQPSVNVRQPSDNSHSQHRARRSHKSGFRRFKSWSRPLVPQPDIRGPTREERAWAAAADPCNIANVGGKCTNCLQDGDEENGLACDSGKELCWNLHACRACGDLGHTITGCLESMSICRCDPIPQHVADQCPMVCRRCWIAEGCLTDAGASKAPLIRECQQHCGICDMDKSRPEHVDANCKRRLKCDFTHDDPSINLSETHFRQDCRDRLCAQFDCTEVSSCNHCGLCGADKVWRSFTHHKCQWNTVWKLGELSPGRKILVAALQCKRNPKDHEVLKICKELVAVRQLGIQRLVKDYHDWMNNGKGAADPRKTRPIIECQKCFHVAWPDGTYETQEPGVEPLPDTW